MAMNYGARFFPTDLKKARTAYVENRKNIVFLCNNEKKLAKRALFG